LLSLCLVSLGHQGYMLVEKIRQKLKNLPVVQKKQVSQLKKIVVKKILQTKTTKAVAENVDTIPVIAVLPAIVLYRCL